VHDVGNFKEFVLRIPETGHPNHRRSWNRRPGFTPKRFLLGRWDWRNGWRQWSSIFSFVYLAPLAPQKPHRVL